MSSAWRYGYDAVLMHRRVQGNTLYMCEQFGVDGKLHVEVIRTSCFMVEDENGLHYHVNQM